MYSTFQYGNMTIKGVRTLPKKNMTPPPSLVMIMKFDDLGRRDINGS